MYSLLFFSLEKRRGNKFEEKDVEENENISNKENVRIKRGDRKIISVGGGQSENRLLKEFKTQEITYGIEIKQGKNAERERLVKYTENNRPSK